MRSQSLFLLLALCGGAACAHGQGLEVDASTLAEAASQMRANMAAIKTWTGEVTVVDEQTHDKDLRRRECHVTFAYRAAPKTLRWNWTVLPPEKAETRINDITARCGVIKDGKKFLVETRDPRKGRENTRVSAQVIEASAGETNAATMGLKCDPLACFGVYANGIHAINASGTRADTFEDIRAESAEDWSIRRNKDYLTIAYKSFLNGSVVNRFTVDLAKGANIIRYETSSDGGNVSAKTIWTWTFEKRGDAWVPSESDLFNDNIGPPNAETGGQATHETMHRHMKWEKSLVNEPVEDGEFALEKIGIPAEGEIDESSEIGKRWTIPSQDGN